jgi:hypothetical protein
MKINTMGSQTLMYVSKEHLENKYVLANPIMLN